MKRIILIGNGFDRSLNLPTRYSDFLDWIFEETLKMIIDNAPKRSNPGGLDYQSENDFFYCHNNLYTLEWIKDLFEKGRNYKFYAEERERIRNQQYFNFSLRPKHAFVSILFDFYDVNGWVDIEQLYFEQLLVTSPSDIDDFNYFFDIVKQKLSEYLEGLVYEKNITDTLNKYRRHFFGKIVNYNTGYQSYEESKTEPDSYYFVNFNYTPFLRNILGSARTEFLNKTVINEIHGDIKNYPIIFGYGNETGDDYSKLEKLGNRFLENIKSTNYFNSTHYRDLERQLQNPYEVYVYGLSCGLSDNILLKTVMQKTNCQQIRIFYHRGSNGDNYRNTLMNISRVFDDKEGMRKKIISKQVNDNIPQIV